MLEGDTTQLPRQPRHPYAALRQVMLGSSPQDVRFGEKLERDAFS